MAARANSSPRKPPTRLRSKLVGNLTSAEYNACARLCLRQQGEMASMLREAWDLYPERGRVIMIEERPGGRLLAWALVIYDGGPRRPPRCDLYVRRSHRRLGLGQRLLLTASRRYGLKGRLCVCAWDKRSRAFYRANNAGLVLSYR